MPENRDIIADNIGFFFDPESIAIIGASSDPRKPSNVIMKSLKNIGYKGNVYPVNPKYSSIDGLKCYGSIGEIDGNIDVAIFALPAHKVPEILKEAAENIRGAIIISSGFKETGEQGRKLEEDIKKIVEREGIRIIGPNCMGIYDTISLMDTFFVSRDKVKRPEKGGISILTQSGSFAMMVMDEMAAEDIGVSRVISYGNRVDIGETDCLDFLADDKHTRVVAIYMESVDKGRDFVDAASRCSSKKPVFAIKVGKGETAIQAARSHTGAMAGRYEIYRAAFKKAGIIEVSEYEQWKDACKVLNTYDPVEGKNVLIITDGGGIGISVADACESLGLEVKRITEDSRERLRSRLSPLCATGNPIDLTGSVTDEDYATALEEGLKEGFGIAIVTVLWGPSGLTDEVVDRIKEVKEKNDTPVLICSPGGELAKQMGKVFEEKGMPVFYTPESVARAAAVLCGAKEQKTLERGDNGISAEKKEELGAIIQKALENGRKNLLETEAKALVSAMGIKVPASIMVRGEKIEEGDLKPPFALKVVSRDILHKTGVAGVKTGIKDIGEASLALEEMRKGISERVPQASIEGFLLEEMAPKGVELIVGGVRDPQFGPAIMFGIGGTAVELMKDVSFRLAPVSREEVFEMMEGIKGYPLLKGFRGSKPVDIQKLASAMIKISDILTEIEEIEEIEINPLLANEKGVVVVDARVVLTGNT